MKKLLWVGFFIIITFVFTNIGYTYYRTNLLPFQSLLLECKAAFIKYPYRDWRKDNTTAEEWEHYDSAKKNYPVINAEIQGDEIVYKNYYNISIAVGTDRGLVVPVLRETDEMSFSDIEKNIGNLGEKARDGKITIDDLQGGTFTITNGGIYGSMLSTPILNPPQSAVLGMHNIVQRPVVVDGQVEVRPIMYLALSYDHRIIDGKEAVSFLKIVKESLEQPKRLFLNI